MTIVDDLDEARAKVKRLELLMASANCRDVGHKMESMGGANCGCEEWSSCSVPVKVCKVCGICDYGDNDDAVEIRRQCEFNKK